MRRFYIITIFFLLISSFVFSQDTTKTKKIKVLPVPAFGYSPETKTYIGAVTLFTFNLYNDSLTRISNAKLEFNYTWNKQIVLESEWNYFFYKEKWFTRGKIHYSQYPDLYYGIGPTTPANNELVFNSNRFLVDVAVLKRINRKLFTGLTSKYIDYSNLKTESTTIEYPELVESSVFSLGYSLVMDTRNNLLTPVKGAYVHFTTAYNFATTNYWEATLDIRYYKTWKDKYTLASRFLNDFSFGSPPFYDLSFLGGDKFVRGYYYGRYRDNNLSSIQTEFRLPIIWRFGLATFGGLSNIYSDKNNFDFEYIRYNYGLGIRFLVDKNDKTNLRFDYAIGNDNNTGFYISFGESF